MTKVLHLVSALALVVIAIAATFVARKEIRARQVPALTTPYQAVALMNGQVFFGRIEQLDGQYIVLRDVFYIQSREDSKTKQVSNVLIKRGGEWHAPDRMILTRTQVQLIEPVKEDSQVAKLIAEQHR